jgi:hypothetical protein
MEKGSRNFAAERVLLLAGVVDAPSFGWHGFWLRRKLVAGEDGFGGSRTLLVRSGISAVPSGAVRTRWSKAWRMRYEVQCTLRNCLSTAPLISGIGI